MSYTKDINIDVFSDDSCYRKLDYPPEQVSYWFRYGYVQSRQWGIQSGKTEVFLLKHRSNERLSHWFLVFRIREHLAKLGCKVRIYQTNQPDIVFETKDGRKVAIEVETGSMLKYKRDALLERVKWLNEAFDYWFFCCNN